MYSTLHNIAPKPGWIKWGSEGVQMGILWVSNGDQNGLCFPTFETVLAELIHGVFLFVSCCDPQCRWVHMPPSVTDAAVPGICS
jgi:hypothetical protein